MDSCFRPFMRWANICKYPKSFCSGICRLCQCFHHVYVDPFLSYLLNQVDNIIKASIDGGLHSYSCRILRGGPKGGIPSLMDSHIILVTYSDDIPVPITLGSVSSSSSFDITSSPSPPITRIPLFSASKSI
jgi:hypothetical protein